MTVKQKENLAKILINTGSLSFGGIVLGYFISTDNITISELISGMIFSLFCFTTAILIDKE